LSDYEIRILTEVDVLADKEGNVTVRENARLENSASDSEDTHGRYEA